MIFLSYQNSITIYLASKFKLFFNHFVIVAKRKSRLIFEGEYVNDEHDKKNGIGKEYKNDEIIFEGEYINDKRWNGKGKEYNYKYLLLYEGNYLNGEKFNGYSKI